MREVNGQDLLRGGQGGLACNFQMNNSQKFPGGFGGGGGGCLAGGGGGGWIGTYSISLSCFFHLLMLTSLSLLSIPRALMLGSLLTNQIIIIHIINI